MGVKYLNAEKVSVLRVIEKEEIELLCVGDICFVGENRKIKFKNGRMIIYSQNFAVIGNFDIRCIDSMRVVTKVGDTYVFEKKEYVGTLHDGRKIYIERS